MKEQYAQGKMLSIKKYYNHSSNHIMFAVLETFLEAEASIVVSLVFIERTPAMNYESPRYFSTTKSFPFHFKKVMLLLKNLMQLIRVHCIISQTLQILKYFETA